jgi:hypothetical protein
LEIDIDAQHCAAGQPPHHIEVMASGERRDLLRRSVRDDARPRRRVAELVPDEVIRKVSAMGRAASGDAAGGGEKNREGGQRQTRSRTQRSWRSIRGHVCSIPRM